MTYIKGRQIYIKENNRYYLAEILVKAHTVVVMPTSEYVEELIGARRISYEEIKKKYLK